MRVRGTADESSRSRRRHSRNSAGNYPRFVPRRSTPVTTAVRMDEREGGVNGLVGMRRFLKEREGGCYDAT